MCVHVNVYEDPTADNGEVVQETSVAMETVSVVFFSSFRVERNLTL